MLTFALDPIFWWLVAGLAAAVLFVTWWTDPARKKSKIESDVDMDFNPTMRRTEVLALLMSSRMAKRAEKKEGSERANDYITHWLYEEMVKHDSNPRRAMKGVYTTPDALAWIRKQEFMLVCKTVLFWAACVFAVGLLLFLFNYVIVAN